MIDILSSADPEEPKVTVTQSSIVDGGSSGPNSNSSSKTIKDKTTGNNGKKDNNKGNTGDNVRPDGGNADGGDGGVGGDGGDVPLKKVHITPVISGFKGLWPQTLSRNTLKTQYALR